MRTEDWVLFALPKHKRTVDSGYKTIDIALLFAGPLEKIQTMREK